MTCEVEADGRMRAVRIERTDRPGRFRVTVDGASRVVDVVRTSDYGLSLLTGGHQPAVTCSDREGPGKGTVPVSTDLQVCPGPVPGELLVSVQGRTISVTVNGRRRCRGDEAASHGHGDINIVAPMPGRVVRVLVGAGEEIAAGQGVIVVEAMKMENELRAPRAGRVREVTVTPGTSVEAGRVLAVIE